MFDEELPRYICSPLHTLFNASMIGGPGRYAVLGVPTPTVVIPASHARVKVGGQS